MKNHLPITIENPFYYEAPANIDNYVKPTTAVTTSSTSNQYSACSSSTFLRESIIEEQVCVERQTVERKRKGRQSLQKAKVKFVGKEEQQQFLKVVAHYKRQSHKLRKGKSKLQERLKLAENFATSKAFTKLQNTKPPDTI